MIGARSEPFRPLTDPEDAADLNFGEPEILGSAVDISGFLMARNDVLRYFVRLRPAPITATVGGYIVASRKRTG